ncbi:MAG: DUF167 family protein [Thermodesulfobacteriota bacterium]
MPFLGKKESAVILYLYIQPRASGNRFGGIRGQELKLALTAPPVDGKANKALIAFLAPFFRVSKSSISILKGKQSRHKVCLINGLSEEYAREMIARVIPELKTAESGK